MNVSDWQDIIGRWSVATFGPKRLERETIGKLREEVEELASAHWSHIGEEAADCLILLLSLAYRTGFDLEAELREKHEENQNRNWVWKGDICHHVE